MINGIANSKLDMYGKWVKMILCTIQIRTLMRG